MPKILYSENRDLNTTLRTLHGNLRSGRWNPSETSNWGTINEQIGYYQLLGNICFVTLYVNVTNPSLGAVSDRITLPVAPMRNTGKTLFYRWAHPAQFNMYDQTSGSDLGTLGIHPTNFTLSTPTYSPAAGTYDLTITGWYWVEE